MNVTRRATRKAAVLVLAGMALAGGKVAVADVRLPHVFGSNMVMQQGMPAHVWGWGDEGEAVTVTLAGKSARTVVKNGTWSVTLPAAATARYGGPYALEVAGKNRITLGNVLIGEVWICSGQSNMDFTMAKTEKRYFAGTENAAAEIAAANYPQLRSFSADWKMTDEPQPDVVGTWSICTPQTAGEFSAVAYYFGRALQQARNVPVGLVTVSYGGSTIQAWMSHGALTTDPALNQLLDQYTAACADWDTGKTQAKFAEAQARWEKDAAEAKAAGKPAPRALRAPRDPRQDQHNPCVLFNGMVAPVTPFVARGVIWYQGESNVATADGYHALLTAMIRDWRQQWGQPTMPFLQVQIAPNGEPDAAPRDSRMAVVREAQTAVARELPNVGTTIILDAGEKKDVHPRRKQPVGERLALLARRIAYGEQLVAESPQLNAMQVEGSEARLVFASVGSGLETRAVTNPDNTLPADRIVGFALAGADGNFVPADARIVGKDTVVVSSQQVTQPVAVRYGWANYPEANLFSKNGLPVAPFRTNVTVGEKTAHVQSK